MTRKPPKPSKPEGMPSAPRAKSKKEKSVRGIDGGVPIVDIDQSRLSDDVPIEIKVAMADAIMAYAVMEGAAERLIWDITGLSYDDGRLLTRIDTSEKFERLKTLTENHGLIIYYNRKTTKDMWTAIKQLMPVRNLIVHGIWAMLDHSIPITVSYRLPTTMGNVVGESFKLDRLRAIARQCYRVKASLDRLSDIVRASPSIRPVQHRPG